MPAFEDIKPGSRLRGLDPEGTAEVVQVARFGPNALSLVRRRASEALPSSQENFPRFAIGNNGSRSQSAARSRCAWEVRWLIN
jgi:hypothetical protein